MKHIKKRFLDSIKIDSDVLEVFNSVPIDHQKIDEIRNNGFEDYYPMMVTDKNIIQAFIYKFKNKQIAVPEPNPIVIYFHIAQQQLSSLAMAKADLFREFEKKQPDLGIVINQSYHYFSAASTAAIFMFNALEAFINLSIPEDYQFSVEKERSTETFNKEQLQRYISFEDKIKKVMPQISNKKFHEEFGSKYERIKKLKSLRDEITHTKTHVDDKPNWYKELFTQLLDFDFFKTIKDCRDYINFHHAELIEECNCGQNH